MYWKFGCALYQRSEKQAWNKSLQCGHIRIHLRPFFPCRIEWMYDYQGMVIMAANQVWWTWEVEDVFRKVKKGDKMGMKNYSKKLHSQIDDLVVQVWSYSTWRLHG